MVRKFFHIGFVLFCFVWATSATAQPSRRLQKAVIESTPLINTTTGKNQRIKLRSDTKLYLYIFLSPDCPLCRNYASTVNKILDAYGEDQIQAYGIIPGKSYPDSSINEYIHTFSIQYPILKDAGQKLTKYMKASTTPEVFLTAWNGEVLYQGAIDNWAVGLGKTRAVTTEHYLANAIDGYLNGLPQKFLYIEPVGCLINEY